MERMLKAKDILTRPLLLATIGFLLALTTSAAAESSGVIDGELKVGNRVIKLTHVYAMEPFQMPDAGPGEAESDGLILILGDRTYPGDLPPIEIDPAFTMREHPFNGAYLALDRRMGAVLYSWIWYTADAAQKAASRAGYSFSTIEVTNLQIANSMVTARLSTVEDNRASKQRSGFHTVNPNGANDHTAGRNAANRGVLNDSVVRLDATLSASILPTPRLLRTLHGHDARTSDVAKAYAHFLVAERDREIAALKDQLAAWNLDEGALKRFQQGFDGATLDAKEIGAIMARLEKVYVYHSRAVLRFRKSSIDSELYTVRAAEPRVRVGVVRSGEKAIATSIYTGMEGARVAVTRSKSTRDSGTSSVYSGALRRVRQAGLIDVHMVQEDGLWRPSTDQWLVHQRLSRPPDLVRRESGRGLSAEEE